MDTRLFLVNAELHGIVVNIMCNFILTKISAHRNTTELQYIPRIVHLFFLFLLLFVWLWLGTIYL